MEESLKILPSSAEQRQPNSKLSRFSESPLQQILLEEDLLFSGNKQANTLEKVGQIRDKFEYDRERRMREKAFAPMNMANGVGSNNPSYREQPFDAQRFFPESERD